MDLTELLLLDYVSENTLPVRVYAGKNVALEINRPSHGLAHDSLIEKISFLCSENLVYLRYSRTDNSEINDMVQLQKHLKKAFNTIKIMSELKRGSEAFKAYCTNYLEIGLTKKGGELWEKEVIIDWDKYLVQVGPAYSRVDNNLKIVSEGWYAAHKQDFLDNVINIYSSCGAIDTIISSQTLEPWNATYWKSFPIGFQTTVHHSASYDESGSGKVDFMCKWRKQWATDFKDGLIEPL